MRDLQNDGLRNRFIHFGRRSMLTRRVQSFFTFLVCLLFCSFLAAIPAMAQSGSQGTIAITVDDSSGALVPETTLTLVAQRTNDVRAAQTARGGTYTFVDLAIGTYTLTVAKTGYATKIYDAIQVQASQVTDLTAVLSVGSTTDTVRVTAEASPVLETSSNQIGTVVDMKQIEDLPL